ncbi:uncharacterized protein LOC121860926 [Homarus americanus]|uniref:uncharacterized protein LOC121860926 n=1 Tax=Homarus americanus TaxID=6706 RepID=UPI001C443238|nr:uncharacterized protein LOC121860926 [Homarus americanus]XP_042214238.1 uncharacterized protein LOC121860926 [Homarus americanus]XP_042214239.1 uncharacterized protein LOC121860926 [Homarus americanus]
MNRAIFLPLLLLALADCSVSLGNDNVCPRKVAAPCHQLTGNTPVGCYDITYTEPNMTVLGAGRGNPERGFYTYTETSTSNWNTLNVEDLQSFVQQGYTLIFRYVILDTFVNSNISDDILLKIGEDFDTLREAGMKVVLRLCYSISESIKSDAKLNQLLSHLNQLTPILDEHAGVIAVVQAGFIGVWGEWYYTENYGDEGVISQANWMDRGTVLSQLMNAIPASRHIQLRTPKYKKVLLNRTSPITKNEAYHDTMVARLGIHNDCFLASDTDYGTYENIAVDYPFLQEETKYLPMGGETCNYNPPRSDCPTALKELRELHFTYLNNGYHEGVLNSWKTQSCYNEVWSSLGYRFVAKWARFPRRVSRGGKVNVGMQIINLGWAAPINYRTAELVLHHPTSGATYYTCGSTGVDLRTWLPGTHSLQLSMTVPKKAPRGRYQVLLRLPDGDSRLKDLDVYNIVIENLVDSNNAARRLNLIGYTEVEN